MVRVAAIAVVTSCFLLAPSALADGEKIIFSPSSASTNSSLSITAPGINALNKTQSEKVQEELFHAPNQTLNNVDSIQGVFEFPASRMHLPPPSEKESAKSRREKDEKKNWAFKDASILTGNSTDALSPSGSADEDSLDLDSSGTSTKSLIEDFILNSEKRPATNSAGPQKIEWSSSVRNDSPGRSGSLAEQNFSAPDRIRISDDSITSHTRTLSADSMRSSVFNDNGSLAGGGPTSQMMDLSALRKQRDSFQSAVDGNSPGLNGLGMGASLGSGAMRNNGYSSDYGNPGASAFHPFNPSANSAAPAYNNPVYAPPVQNTFTAPQSSTPNAAYSANPSESIIKRPKL